MNKTRILYVAATSKGGSAFSLFHMMQGLDRTEYEPMVAFYASEGSHIEERMHEHGVKTCFLSQAPGSGDAQLSAPNDAQSQSQDTGHWLEARFGRPASKTYHWLRAHYQYLRQDQPLIRPLVRLIRENEIDLIHFNNTLRSAKPAVKATRITRTPCVCHVRGFTHLRPYDLAYARDVDLFVYISRAVEQDCRQQGINQPGVVIHNVVDLDEFPDPQERGEYARSVRDEFGWPHVTPLVGVVGRLDWWKGHETFLQAIAKATAAPNLKALIVGEPVDTPKSQQYYQDLETMIQTLGLQDRVVFTGFRKDITRLMSALDIIVLSSSTPEPFGRVVIEGMAAGRPVVATAAGGVLDIIRDGLDGRLVPIQDADAMAQAIVDLVLDPQKARAMGIAARERVESKFTLPLQIDTIQKVYRAILSTPPTDRAHIEWQHILEPPGLCSSPSS